MLSIYVTFLINVTTRALLLHDIVIQLLYPPPVVKLWGGMLHFASHFIQKPP